MIIISNRMKVVFSRKRGVEAVPGWGDYREDIIEITHDCHEQCVV